MSIDPVLLKMGCSWSMKAYEDEPRDAIKIESKLTSTTVFIAKRKTVDVIAFRGSQQAVDFLFDVFAFPVPFAGRLCHGGFTLALKSVWDEIEPHIDYSKRTILCGHSLGGALAELAAAKIHKKHKNLNLVTFGKPNTFFKGFKRPMALDKQYSLIRGSDMVARMPRLLYGPSSSQTVIYFTNFGGCKINPTARLKRQDFMTEPDEAVSDHFMEGYKLSLDEWLDGIKRSKDRKKLEEIEAEMRGK
jgi:pimeloyl-ACP methyl ester carboxylesterase